MENIFGETLTINLLNDRDKREMLCLMQGYFVNVTPGKFEEDLREKQRVIVMRNSNGKIVGFSTVTLVFENINKKDIVAIFSGDTIVDKSCWGERELVKKLGKYFIEVIEKYRSAYCYWYLISKGYKTYRYLPLYFKEYYPRFEKETPEFERLVIDKLSERRYPGKYDSKRGIVSFGADAEYLKNGVADITPARLKDPNVSFFVAKNPGYMKGDELACIGILTGENLTNAFYKVVLGNNLHI